MLLREAKEILKNNGYELVEGSMSLEDKIKNAKDFNNPGIKQFNAFIAGMVKEGFSKRTAEKLWHLSDEWDWLLDDSKDPGDPDEMVKAAVEWYNHYANFA